MKGITHLNEHESFAISKLCWTNILKYLPWVYYSYTEIEWVLNEIKISIVFLPRVENTAYMCICVYAYIHTNIICTCVCIYIYTHVYDNLIRCRRWDKKLKIENKNKTKTQKAHFNSYNTESVVTSVYPGSLPKELGWRKSSFAL